MNSVVDTIIAAPASSEAQLPSRVLEIRPEESKLVFVGAEAGAGKTSLAAALLGKVEPPARRLLGRCDGATTPRPLSR